MARKGRFTQARIYVAGSSIALLLGVWGLLASQDARSREAYLSANDASDASIAVVNGATPDRTGDGADDDDGDDNDVTIAAPAPTTPPSRAPQVQSRSGGS